MEHRVLEITLQYAKDLNKVTLISKMGVYVVVSISDGDKTSNQKAKTPPDHDGDANPMWRFNMRFTVEEAALLQNRLMLHFKLKCERALADKVVGEVHVPVKDLLDFPANGGAGDKKFVSYQVKKPSGKAKGQLTFSYRFGGGGATKVAPPVEEACGVSKITYPVVEPIFTFPATAAGGYPPADGCGGVSKITYPVVEPIFTFPATASGGYPPAEGCGGVYLPPAGYAPAPPPPADGYVHPPQVGFGIPPRMMQLGPNWWIVDWRYDFRCS